MADAAHHPRIWSFQPLSGADEARECALLMAASEPWITLQRDEQSAFAILQDPGKDIVVAHDDAGVAGFIIVDHRGPFPGYIQTICVRPDCRGQGLGTALVRWAEDRIFLESPNVFMCVSSFNPDARRLYERLGYEVVGVLREYIVPGHDEILLRKSRGSWTTFRHARRR